jgi:Sap, sulfolipid-1-addressing protein
VGWIDAELVVVALAAMLSPTTLSFSVLALVLGDRPRRTGPLFLVGALSATLAVGVVAAFVLGDVAASPTSSPKTWVAILDIIFAVILFAWVLRVLRRPVDPKKMDGMIAQMSKIASSPFIVIVGAGAALANAGAFIPIALKDISETNPSAAQYIVDWIFFSVVAVLPLIVATVMLFVARGPTERALITVRDWLIKNAMKLAAAIVALLALSLLRNGIAGLVN